ncbi:MAG: hypothetical protein RL456_635 [Pseudomonadota bacterium]|jgi:hypothetical protein
MSSLSLVSPRVRALAVAAAALLAGASSFAATVDAGTVGTTPYGTSFSNPPGYFFDTVNFDVSTAGTLSVSLTDLTANVGSMILFLDQDLEGVVWDNHHPGGLSQIGHVIGDGSTYVFTLPSAGDYHLDVSGYAIGSAGGVYAVGLQVSPIPEPGTWAMMAAGLGVLGAVARRRRTAA